MDKNRLEANYNRTDTLYAECLMTHDWNSEHPELIVGQICRVSQIGVLRACTFIILEDFPDTEYNSGIFRILEDGNEIDYTKDDRFLAPYLRRLMEEYR